MTVTGDFASVK